MDGQGTTWRRNIAENFNRLSGVHQRYRRHTDDRQTDGRQMTYSERELEFTFAKNFTEIVPGEPLRWGLNPKGVAKYSDFRPFEGSRKRCKISYKLVLITNRKSHMSFRLVPNSVTFGINLERRNSPNRRVILPNLVAFGRIT